jgi:hypothetical protein
MVKMKWVGEEEKGTITIKTNNSTDFMVKLKKVSKNYLHLHNISPISTLHTDE